ncbi:MAG: hypothetical protein GY810_31205 [Aureispira sp.]|nr:hypothetical protein [Aureispira sp.]
MKVYIYIMATILFLGLVACSEQQTTTVSQPMASDTTIVDTPTPPITPINIDTPSNSTILKALNPRDLIETYFEDAQFKNDKSATYKYEEEPMQVNYVGEQSYQENGIDYVLTFFESFNLDKNGERDWGCHACSGKLSIAQFQKGEKGLTPIDFTYDCPCGTANMGGVSIPKVVLIGNRHFLEKNVGDMGQRISIELLYYYDIKDYKELLKLTVAESNEGDAPSKEEMYAYDATITHYKDDSKNMITVQYTGTTYTDDMSIIPHNKTETYTYNLEKQKFIKK